MAGAYTCRYDLTEGLQYVEDLLEVVHVFTYEPYPSFPQASFLTGAVTESSVSVPQCATFANCSASAHSLVDAELLFPYSYIALDNMVGIYDDPVGGWVGGCVGGIVGGMNVGWVGDVGASVCG